MITQNTEFAILQDESTKMTRLYKKGYGWSEPLSPEDWDALKVLHGVMRTSDPSEFLANMGTVGNDIQADNGLEPLDY
jgi:hypothetical protein